ncbi:Uncharacterised protein [Mycobacteroides abscessus]|nr:Uncharacterised protein [Mycobacteroides abscessus]
MSSTLPSGANVSPASCPTAARTSATVAGSFSRPSVTPSDSISSRVAAMCSGLGPIHSERPSSAPSCPYSSASTSSLTWPRASTATTSSTDVTAPDSRPCSWRNSARTFSRRRSR